MKPYPPFSTHVYQPRKMSPGDHAAECKRVIEDAWRGCGVQVLVIQQDGAIRSNLVNGMPR